MRDKIDDLFTGAKDLSDDTLRVEGVVRITPDGLPIFTLKFSRSITEQVMSRDQLEMTIKRLSVCLHEMDNWMEENR